MKPVVRGGDYTNPDERMEPWQLMLGKDSRERATKTNHPNNESAVLMNLVDVKTENRIDLIRDLVTRETGLVLTNDQLIKQYKGLRVRWEFTYGTEQRYSSVGALSMKLSARATEPHASDPGKEASHKEPQAAVPKFDG